MVITVVTGHKAISQKIVMGSSFRLCIQTETWLVGSDIIYTGVNTGNEDTHVLGGQNSQVT